jgi:hypothetical protein
LNNLFKIKPEIRTLAKQGKANMDVRNTKDKCIYAYIDTAISRGHWEDTE